MFRKTLLFAVLLLILAFPLSLSAKYEYDMPPEPKNTPPAYYLKDDFYFWDKEHKKVILKAFPRAIVVYSFSDAESVKKAVESASFVGANSFKVEKLSALLGIQEGKAIVGRQDYYVINFSRDIDDVVSLLNFLVADKKGGITHAYPVFLLDNDLVFPAGLWVKTKEINYETEQFLKKRYRMAVSSP